MLENPLIVPSLLSALVVLQLFVLAMLFRLSGRVSRLSRLFAAPVAVSSKELAERKEANGDQKKWFDEFLAEDPSRQNLPKKEQFAAFRCWREERGLNWKVPTGTEREAITSLEV